MMMAIIIRTRGADIVGIHDVCRGWRWLRMRVLLISSVTCRRTAVSASRADVSTTGSITHRGAPERRMRALTITTTVVHSIAEPKGCEGDTLESAHAKTFGALERGGGPENSP